MPENGDINLVLSKTLSVLLQTKLPKPIRNVLQATR